MTSQQSDFIATVKQMETNCCLVEEGKRKSIVRFKKKMLGSDIRCGVNELNQAHCDLLQ